MSFFGQQNNNQPQQGTGFGGFGSNNNAAPGFGQPQNTGFGAGANNSGGSLFGSNSTGFGTGAGTGFGATSTNATPFGSNRSGFGTNATTSGAMFGSNTATAGASSGFGGFGATNNNNNTSGSLFGGSNKSAFGTGNASGGSIFGGGSGGNAFGTASNQPTSAFGAPLSSALGANVAESQGTASTPFQATLEKESGTATSNNYQSISFMQPYKNYSFEELRQADYNQGRRYGNASGQPGAFGANTGFGGFGQQSSSNAFGTTNAGSGTGLFGAQPTSTASAFGGTQTANSGFGGANTGGSMFGNAGSKPATSLFGTNATSSQQSGGIFGTAGNSGFGTGSTGTGFGGGNNTGTGIFGGSNQQQAPKTGFPFSGTNAGNAFGSGGTNTNNSGGGIFGAGASNSAFGSGQQQQQAPASNPFGGFGNNQPQAQTATPSAFGGFGTNNQQTQKPGGMFGQNNDSSATGGGIFGNNNQQNNQQQPATGSIFGNPPNNQSGTGSLFGPKPASNTTSLFGQNASNAANNSGTSLFGSAGFNNNNNQNQQTLGGGLFNNPQQQQQQAKTGSLFGGTGTTAGGSLFNNNNQQPSGGSLFANLGANNQPQQSLFGNANNSGGSSIFNNTPQQPNVLQPPQAQLATLEGSPYGNPSIFYGLPPTETKFTGPVATPIKSANKTKKNAILPQYKINPHQASRLATPQKRGFGFTYSTYGTPSSASSLQSTPGGLNGSLLYGSVGRNLGKSLSTSNLHRAFDREADSLLTPGAFSAGSARFSNSGSMKKLTIDRSLRTDLFGTQSVAALPSPEKSDQSRQPGILKKKVSFDASTAGGKGVSQNISENGDTNGLAVQNSREPTAQEQGFLRSSTRGHSRSNGTILESEMEHVKNNELAIVHEDGSPESVQNSTAQLSVPSSQDDPAPGAYYMIPPREKIEKLSTEERKHVVNFTVGREGCGFVEFNEPVDLTITPLDDIYGKIALIELRSLTVYPETDRKPPLGKGLNVPSTIFLKNSWPRQRDRKTLTYEKSGPRFNKHVDRLRKVVGTEFQRYEKDTGTWVFKVPHFTTYGFDYDDTGSEGDSLQTSVLSEAPYTPTPKSRAPRDGDTPRPDVSQSSILSDEQSLTSSSLEDTFEFRKKKILPGAFDYAASLQNNNIESGEDSSNDESFLDERLASSPSDSGADEPSELQDSNDKVKDRSLVLIDEDVEMAGAYPRGDLEDPGLGPTEPKPIGYGTPQKLTFNPTGDWAEELQRTISPRKQDRQALRKNQLNLLDDQGINRDDTPKATESNDAGNTLATSIDLMNSLFGEEQARRSVRSVKRTTNGNGKGFEWPYSKSKNQEGDESNMSHSDRQFHESYKPHWSPSNVLFYSMPSDPNSKKGYTKTVLVYPRNTIQHFLSSMNSPSIPKHLIKQRKHTTILIDQGVPFAKFQRIPFREIAASADNAPTEIDIWELATILFDEIATKRFMGDSSVNKEKFNHLLRKDCLSQLWQKICEKPINKPSSIPKDNEERTILYLSTNNVVKACNELVSAKNYRLAILVSQIGRDRIMREDMAAQINEWRNLNALSEMTEPIRALYELLAGNVGVCEGKKGPLEDRAKTFVISQRFGMNWKNAFGLRLWYATLAEEPIEAAVKKYANDLESHEVEKPFPVWAKPGNDDDKWNDPKSDQREDGLWGLLKLYAASQNVLSTPSLASIITPHNTTANPLDTLFPFQLYHALASHFPSAAEPGKADELALDLSARLNSVGEWIWAIFILLFVSSREQRQSSIQRLIGVRAGKIPDADTPIFETLTKEFKIPEPWIWEAKALHARCVTQNHVQEIKYLLKAGNWDEAHNILCRVVAPQAVVERDYVVLKDVLDAFHDGREFVAEWELGGGIYEDFVTLVLDLSKGHEHDGAEDAEQSKSATLNRLLTGLPGMEQERVGRAGLEETVAVREMSDMVAKTVTVMSEDKSIEPWRVLRLPLTQEAYRTHVLRFGLGYYEAIMAGKQ